MILLIFEFAEIAVFARILKLLCNAQSSKPNLRFSIDKQFSVKFMVGGMTGMSTPRYSIQSWLYLLLLLLKFEDRSCVLQATNYNYNLSAETETERETNSAIYNCS